MSQNTDASKGENITVDGLAGGLPIKIDCSEIIEAVTLSVNQSHFEKLEKLILAQQQQINTLLPAFSRIQKQPGSSAPKDKNTPEKVVPLRKVALDVTNNTPDGVQSSNNGVDDGISISGSNQWYHSMKEGQDQHSSHSTQESSTSAKTFKADEVFNHNQEYWYQASTDDFEKENNANGDEISSSLASAAKVFWHKTVKQEALKLKLDKASTPVNCAFLLPKRTNTEVWKNLPSYVRTGDVKLQEVQKQQAASVVMILRAASELTEASKQPGGNNPQVKEVMNALKEAMILSGSTCQLINQFRRDQMKPSVSKEFKKLATDNDESSDFLFGSSVCDRLETLKKENKLAALLDKEKDKKRKRYEPTETRSSNYRPSYKSQKRAPTRARNQKSQTGNKRDPNHQPIKRRRNKKTGKRLYISQKLLEK